MTDTAFLSHIAALVPNAIVPSSEHARFLTEWRGDYASSAIAIVAPASVAEVSSLIRACAQFGVSVVPQGGNTGLCGGAVSRHDQLLLSSERMNSIKSVSIEDDVIVAEAGVALATVQSQAEAVGRYFPLSLSAEGSCQIGGNLSTNAGGVNFLKYGGAREQLLGLEVVLADGTVLSDLHGLRKNNVGYDWKQWFVGAEGTLGVITAASLKLWPKPQKRQVVWLGFDTLPNVLDVFHRLRGQLGNTMVAYELVSDLAMQMVAQHLGTAGHPLGKQAPWNVLFEVHGGALEVDSDAIAGAINELIGDKLVTDAVVASNSAQEQALWRARHAISPAQTAAGGSIKHDVALPLSHLVAFVDDTKAALASLSSDIAVVCFGHIGDGNLHYNVAQLPGIDDACFAALRAPVHDIVHDAVLRHHGSISAEHGIGMKKTALLKRQLGSDIHAQMKAIKRALDPAGLMNPGKVL
ncbi:MAG: FAD-binding oxidoreductase [Pseudomonadota bacterium]